MCHWIKQSVTTIMMDTTNQFIKGTKDVSTKNAIFKELMAQYEDDTKSTEEQWMYCVYEMFSPFILSRMTKTIMRQFRLEYISFPEIHRTNKIKEWIRMVGHDQYLKPSWNQEETH